MGRTGRFSRDLRRGAAGGSLRLAAHHWSAREPGRNCRPVLMVAASVVCGGSGGTAVATTGAVSLSSIGDAHIETSLTIPSPCIAPVVLLRIANPGTQPGAFIALTGLSSNSAQMNDNDIGDNDRSSKSGGR